MKRILKLLSIILLSTSGIMPLLGMNYLKPTALDTVPQMAEDNDVQMLGEALQPGGLSLLQKRDKEAKNVVDAKAKKVVEAKKPNSDIKKQADGKKIRSLIDVLPANFAKIPAAVWRNHFAPCLDRAMFPMTMKPMYDNRLIGRVVWQSKDQSRCALKNIHGIDIVDMKSGEKLYTLPHTIDPDFLRDQEDMLSFSPDEGLVISRKGSRLIISELSTGKLLQEIGLRAEIRFPYFGSKGKFLLVADGQEYGHWRIRCFDSNNINMDGNPWTIADDVSSYEISGDDRFVVMNNNNGAVHVYDTVTKKISFEAPGSSFAMLPDGSRIAVAGAYGVKVFDLNDKEHKELFSMPGLSLLYLTNKDNRVVCRDDNTAKLKIYDVLSGQVVFEVEDRNHFRKSSDGNFIAIEKDNREGFLAAHNTFSITIYDIASKNKVFEETANYGNCSFSEDSRYYIINREHDGEVSRLVDLRSGESLQFPKSSLAVSPNGQLCAVSKMVLSQRAGLFAAKYRLELTLIDLRSKKEIGKFATEAISANGLLAKSRCYFSVDSNKLIVEGNFRGYHVQDTYNSPVKNLVFDVSTLKDKNFQDAFANKLTPEQTALLMVLDETKQKNGDKPISLLHDVALKRMLSLKELQATLATFHPLIIQSIIKQYKIIDPTPTVAQKAKEDQRVATKNFWRSIVKATGFATLLGALGAWYYFKKK